MRGFLSPDEKQFSDISCLLSPHLQSPTRGSAAPCHPTCCRRPCLGFVFYRPVSPPSSFASGLRAPPLASQSFQVLWAHFLLLSIPENSSLTSQAFSCLFLRQQSFCDTEDTARSQKHRLLFFCCILRIEATGKWVKHILTSASV